MHGRFNHPDFFVEIAISGDGLRDDATPRARTDKKRMLELGDSFAWGFGVEKPARFSERMEQKHPDWEIINAAVSGYGTGHEFLYLQRQCAAYRPDVVLLLFCENDFADNVRAEDHCHFRLFFEIRDGRLVLCNTPVPAPTFGQRARRFLLGRMYLGSRLYLAKEALLRAMRSNTSKEPISTYSTVEMENAVIVTGMLLREINAYCQDMGAALICASMPMDAERRAIFERLADKMQIPHLALDPFFEADVSNLHFAHDLHWNGAGHAVAAEAIDRFLRQEGVWGPDER